MGKCRTVNQAEDISFRPGGHQAFLASRGEIIIAGFPAILFFIFTPYRFTVQQAARVGAKYGKRRQIGSCVDCTPPVTVLVIKGDSDGHHFIHPRIMPSFILQKPANLLINPGFGLPG
ncbi:hypothetical protein DXM32_12610 [Salmonella enterica]|nr:hypothetical protein [Salmonella enterica]EBK9381251.1 hypothetical protein [Salmonella enterica]